MAQVISFMNFKGGVGKTTNTAMFGYRLAKRGKRVLLVDMDPQANLTTLMDRTVQAEKRFVLAEQAKSIEKELNLLYAELGDEQNPAIEGRIKELEYKHEHLVFKHKHAEGLQVNGYLVDGLKAGSFLKSISQVADNLLIVANNLKSIHYADVVDDALNVVVRSREERYQYRITYLRKLIEEVRDQFDYILIDVPPTISVYVDSAAYASDWILGVLQTQTRSLEGSHVLVEHFVEFKEKHDLALEFIGFICVIQNNRSVIDKQVEELAVKAFGEESIFKTVVKQMERLKRYDDEGILDLDMHDKNVMKVYDALVEELEQRLAAAVEV